MFIEVGLTGAYNMVGRYNIDDTKRKTGRAWQAGVFGIAAISRFSVAVLANREFPGTAPGTAIETLELNGCSNPASLLAFCGNYTFSRGQAMAAGRAQAENAQTLQLTLGFGLVRAK